jgi:hypothetical protein
MDTRYNAAYHLSSDQLRSIQAYLDKSIGELSEIGLEFHIDSNMAAWVRFMETAPGIGRINTTYDPRFSNASTENCFWIYVKNHAGQIVGCVCSRYFQTDDFLDLIRNNLLFFDKKPICNHVEMTFEIPDDSPVLAGRVGHGGGLWAHPDYRGIGLSAVLPPMVRALAVRHFDIDWNTVASRNTANRLAMFKQSYGYDHTTICTSARLAIGHPMARTWTCRFYIFRARIC